MKENFKKGDMVVLNSGGPLMTIQGFQSDNPNRVECMWFLNGILETEEFPLDCLRTPKFQEL